MFDLTKAQREKLEGRMANWFMMDRRGNPDMGGPNPFDRLRASKMASDVEWWLAQILEEDE